MDEVINGINVADMSMMARIEWYLLFKFESRSLFILIISVSVDFSGKYALWKECKLIYSSGFLSDV